MEKMQQAKIKDLLKSKDTGKECLVRGWVRTKRGNKNVNFIALNDGSVIHTIQVVVEVAQFNEELLKLITTGACAAEVLVRITACGLCRYDRHLLEQEDERQRAHATDAGAFGVVSKCRMDHDRFIELIEAAGREHRRTLSDWRISRG